MGECSSWLKTCVLFSLGMAFSAITVWMAQTEVRGFQAVHSRPEGGGGSCAGPMQEMQAQMAQLAREVSALSTHVRLGGNSQSLVVELKQDLLSVLRTEIREQMHRAVGQGGSAAGDSLVSRLPALEQQLRFDVKRMLDNVKKNISSLEQDVLQAMDLVRAATIVDVKAADRAAASVKEIMKKEYADLKTELMKDTSALNREMHADFVAETQSLKEGFASLVDQMQRAVPAMEAVETRLVTSVKKEMNETYGAAVALAASGFRPGASRLHGNGASKFSNASKVCPRCPQPCLIGTKQCSECPDCPACPAAGADGHALAPVEGAGSAKDCPACPVVQPVKPCPPPPPPKPDPICNGVPHGFSAAHRVAPWAKFPNASSYRVVKLSDAKWLAASVARPAPYNDLVFTTWQGANLGTRFWYSHLWNVGLRLNALMITYRGEDCVGLPRQNCVVHNITDLLSAMQEKEVPASNGGEILGGGLAVVDKWLWTLAFLKAGFNVLFSDNDVAFVRNPLVWWNVEKFRHFDMMGLTDWRVELPPVYYCDGARRNVSCQSTGLMFFRNTSLTTGVVEKMVREATPPGRPWEQALWQKFIPQIAGARKGAYQMLPIRVYFNLEWMQAHNPHAVAVHMGYVHGFCLKMHSFWCAGLGVQGLEQAVEATCKGAAVW